MQRNLSGSSVVELAVSATDPALLAAVCNELGYRKTRQAHVLAASLGCDVKTGSPHKHIDRASEPLSAGESAREADQDERRAIAEECDAEKSPAPTVADRVAEHWAAAEPSKAAMDAARKVARNTGRTPDICDKNGKAYSDAQIRNNTRNWKRLDGAPVFLVTPQVEQSASDLWAEAEAEACDVPF